MSGFEVFCECVYIMARNIENILIAADSHQIVTAGEPPGGAALTGLTPPPSRIGEISTPTMLIMMFLGLFAMMAFGMRRQARQNTPREEISTQKPQLPPPGPFPEPD